MSVQYKYIRKVDSEEKVERYKVKESETIKGKCPGCGQEVGKYHLVNCDVERCPICGEQLYSCYCWESYTETVK